MRIALAALALALPLGGCQKAVEPRSPVPETDPSTAYEALLMRVVTEDGYVDWTALRQNPEPLDRYVAWLSRKAAIPEDRDAAHATWLNAYNAWTLLGVLDNGVPDSVRDVKGWLPKKGAGFFYEQTFSLGGQRVSLYTAEHKHIRRGFEDWRDHAALNCASASCPPLRRELYDPARLDEQLDDQARRWAMDPVRGWYVDGEVVVFSPLFEWFRGDFPTEQPGGLCQLMARHAESGRQTTLMDMAEKGCPRDFFEYDWRLNRPTVRGQVPPRQQDG
jgi:hypothetical protein